MGTDIHCVLEKKVDDRWEFVKYLNFCRNYDLFAVLADVRNARGFAGCDTGNPIIPISEPRGFPHDISSRALEVMSHEHSASYILGEELLTFKWNQPITKRRDAGEYRQYEWTVPLLTRMPLKLKALLRFLKTHNDHYYRIVFDFDS